jgi:hypothetical protein
MTVVAAVFAIKKGRGDSDTVTCGTAADASWLAAKGSESLPEEAV